MSINNKAERLSYILRGKNRCEIYQILLSGPRTQSEISKKTAIPASSVSRIIKQFEHYKLVENLTPSQRIGGRFRFTPLGLEFKSEFEDHKRFRESN